MTNELLSKHTGQPIEQIKEDTDRDHFMSAQAARAYGLIDALYAPKDKLVIVYGVIV